ncbi:MULTISPECIES: alpha/beta hydrolase family protein [unclassified Bradyrhizobium]|uniref:alpha/beta hydrolase family protein n=1 Tax=unclassified Bradyrhizobium TaxID=2631580 RepID=UPI002915E8F7|nr:MULTISPECIES: alpha/beta hydrolase family protein [unclassified Bradyrhizobium]
MRTFVLVHGAWHGGWCWQRVVPLLERAGHVVSAPTLAGLAERAPLLSRDITLETHVAEIVDHVLNLGRTNVTLVGHSYGGFPATAAAYRLSDLVSHLVLLDAFLPDDGEILLDHAPHLIESYRASAMADPGWHIPPLPAAVFGIRKEDQPWVDSLLTPQPVGSYFEPAMMRGTLPIARKTYIRCTQANGDLLEKSVSRVRERDGWRYLELDASHDAMITHAQLLADALMS